MTLISVIIPVYNTAEYLGRCLESVLSNTYKNLEIICIDDGSTDHSGDILREYAQKDSRIVVITQENAGVSAARNAGLDRATGTFVAFVDSDDWVHVRYFEVLLNGALENNADIAVCSMKKTGQWMEDAEILPEKPAFRESGTSGLNGDVKRYVWARIYRRSLIGGHRFVQGVKLAEDALFNLELFVEAGNISCVICEVALYCYFMRETSAVHTLDGRNLKPLITRCLEHVMSGSADGQARSVMLCEAIKKLLSWRYGAILKKNKAELMEIKELMRTAMALLRKSEQIPAKQKLMYSMLTAMPFLYRGLRILTDPTMLNYEKRVKEEQRAKKEDAK